MTVTFLVSSFFIVTHFISRGQISSSANEDSSSKGRQRQVLIYLPGKDQSL